MSNKQRQTPEPSANKPDVENNRAQSQRFVDKALEIDCDEDEAAFKEKLGVIARQKPKSEPPRRKTKELK